MPQAAPPSSSTGESPLDRALALSLADDKDAALRWAAALVRLAPARPIGLFVTARLMAELGEREAALGGLEVCVTRAVDGGNLPLAVAAAHELAALGADTAEHLDEIARTFCAGSPRLLAAGKRPPDLRGDRGFQPLAARLRGQALLSEARKALDAARELLAKEQTSRAEAPKVPPEQLFSALDQDGLRAMIDIFDTATVPAGAVLIEEGTGGAEAYIVARGELEVRRKAPEEGQPDILLARLGSGALFGEMALLSRSPRAASVVACRPTLILVARKEALDEVAAREPAVGIEFAKHCRRRMVENLVRTSTILSAVKPHERPALVERFVTRTFEEGELLITQGQESNGLYLIASGEVSVVVKENDESTVISKLGAGEVVGEVALVLRRPSNADVIAIHPTVTLHLPREQFLELIKQHPTLLSQLYELAVKRDEETSSIVAQEATDADEFILI